MSSWWWQQHFHKSIIMAFNPSCVFRMPWVLHQMPGRDTVPVSYCNHGVVRGRGPVLWMWTRGPLWHRHHPPELLWGRSEPHGCPWCLHHVSLNRFRLTHTTVAGQMYLDVHKMSFKHTASYELCFKTGLSLDIFLSAGSTSSSTWSMALLLPSSFMASCWWWRASSPVEPSKTCMETSRLPHVAVASVPGWE